MTAKTRIATTLALAAAGAIGLAAASAAAPAYPDSGRLDFKVMRKGSDIGSFDFTFARSGNTLTVHNKTNVAVKVPFVGIALYKFVQDATETWQNGHLVHLTSKTDDNGKHHALSLGATALVPASLWDRDIVTARKALNTIDGKAMTIKVVKLGADMVPSGGGTVKATHYRITGGLTRDLWYDGHGILAKVAFKGSDGSEVQYIRK